VIKKENRIFYLKSNNRREESSLKDGRVGIQKQDVLKINGCVEDIDFKTPRGEQDIKKPFDKLNELKAKIKQPAKRSKKRTKADLEKKIKSLVGSHVPENLIQWELQHLIKDAFELNYWIHKQEFDILKD